MLIDLNKSINRALREASDVSSKLAAASGMAVRNEAVTHAREALRHLATVQDLLVKEAPDLGYHYDASKPPTKFMLDVASLVKEAESLIGQRDVRGAEKALQKALDMEPPPFAYEVIAKRLDALRGKT